MPKPERGATGTRPNNEHQKLQKLYTGKGAAYGCLRNLVKTSNLPVSKVRCFTYSKPSHLKFTPVTRKFKGTKAVTRTEEDNWCMNQAYVDTSHRQ